MVRNDFLNRNGQDRVTLWRTSLTKSLASPLGIHRLVTMWVVAVFLTLET